VIGHIDITRPPADVFAYVSDQTNGPEWQQVLNEVRRITDGAIEVATRHTFVRRVGRRQVTGDTEYVEFEPGRRVVFTFASSDGLTGQGWYEVDPLGTDKTRLDSGVELHPRSDAPRLAAHRKEHPQRRQQGHGATQILESANTATNGAHQ
jgi:uncharacterized protein YndB with AHSA1/START domain